MFKRILKELEHHAPFTIFGAITGVIIVLLFHKVPNKVAYNIFYVLHPFHILLSALVTASMYKIHKCKNIKDICNLWMLLFIGYAGSIGIATISDSIIPYIGEFFLNMPHREPHIGFIEKWWLINPLAIAGIVVAYFKPSTKIPHSFHVLLSTWASLSHILMAMGDAMIDIFSYFLIFVFLFIAVWLPCCTSDIVFPLVFVGETQENQKDVS